MRIDHFQMALGDRQIDWLTHSTTRMVEARMHIDQLHEIAEIFHRGIAALALKVAHKWRAINRCKHGFIAANLNRPRWVPCMLGKARRSSRTKLAGQSAREMHPLTFDVTPDIAQDIQCFRIIPEIDTDLF